MWNQFWCFYKCKIFHSNTFGGSDICVYDILNIVEAETYQIYKIQSSRASQERLGHFAAFLEACFEAFLEAE